MGASSSYPTSLALPSTRTVIVTGGNTGIGYETAKAIARMGARVIIACRSEERAKEVLCMQISRGLEKEGAFSTKLRFREMFIILIKRNYQPNPQTPV